MSQLDERYEFSTGELVIDLTELTDLENLDGHFLELEGGIGKIEVIVPRGVEVTVTAEVGGPGNVQLFGDQRGGIASELQGAYRAGDVDLTIDATLGVGEIYVDTE